MFGAMPFACFYAPPVFAVSRPCRVSSGAGAPLFRFRILIFHIPQTRDLIRRAACLVKRKDNRMVNRPENSERVGSGGDLLSRTKPEPGGMSSGMAMTPARTRKNQETWCGLSRFPLERPASDDAPTSKQKENSEEKEAEKPAMTLDTQRHHDLLYVQNQDVCRTGRADRVPADQNH